MRTQPSLSYSEDDDIGHLWSKRGGLKLSCDSFLTMVLSFIVLGRKNDNACKGVPKTCSLLDKFPETTGCRRGQVPRVLFILGGIQLPISVKGMLPFTEKPSFPLPHECLSFHSLLMKQFYMVDVRIEGGKCSECIALWNLGVLIFSSFSKIRREY